MKRMIPVSLVVLAAVGMAGCGTTSYTTVAQKPLYSPKSEQPMGAAEYWMMREWEDQNARARGRAQGVEW